MEQYFKAVKVEDELPTVDNRFFVFTMDKNGVTFERRASFYNGEWIIDLSFEYETVTHWLKPCPQPDAEKVTATIPYQCCPKCEGQGIVSKPSYIAGDVREWSSSSAVHVCDVCNGAKIIPQFIIQQSTAPKQG